MAHSHDTDRKTACGTRHHWEIRHLHTFSTLFRRARCKRAGLPGFLPHRKGNEYCPDSISAFLLFDQGSVTNRPWRATLKGAAASTAALVLCPWLGELLFVRSFVMKLMITIVMGNVTTIILTHFYASLPVRWFACGKCEGHPKSAEGVWAYSTVMGSCNASDRSGAMTLSSTLFSERGDLGIVLRLWMGW